MADVCEQNEHIEAYNEIADDGKASQELQLIEAIRYAKVNDVRRLASQWDIQIDYLDKNGMTPLMHAAYKGAVEVVEILITHGADVNKKSVEHEYTPLMFATLAGSKETARILLEAGADPSAENKIHKTAPQMGAFVGRHECVSLINNYIAKQDIEYYTKPQGLETEAKLAPFLAEPLQRFIIIANLHPVHICMFLKENVPLLENSKSVAKILDLKCENLFKKEINEVMAMKVHYFACIHKRCCEWHKREGIDGFIRMLIKGRPEDGFPIAMEDFIRESIRSFPYRESNLLTQLVKTIAPVTKGREPTALSALTQAINGFQSANYSDACTTCGMKDAVKKCSACKMVKYCSQPCQKLHWFTHKKHCKCLAKQYEKAMQLDKEMAEMSVQHNEAESEASVRSEENQNYVETSLRKTEIGDDAIVEHENVPTHGNDDNNDKDEDASKHGIPASIVTTDSHISYVNIST